MASMAHGEEDAKQKLFPFPRLELIVLSAIVIGAVIFARLQGNAIRRARFDYMKSRDLKQEAPLMRPRDQ